MRTIERSSAFKKDFKRIKANPKHIKTVDERLKTALELLLQWSTITGILQRPWAHRYLAQLSRMPAQA